MTGSTDHRLVTRLRDICASGESALRAATQYDQNFELKLADCADDAAAEALVSDWMARRVDILHRTARDLKRTRSQALNKAEPG